MSNTRQTVPPGISASSVKNIPKDWNAQWFRDFITQYLQHGDTRNATAGAGISITGTIGVPATIASSAISGPPYSVFGNASGTIGDNTGISATIPNTVLTFTGTSLAFGRLLLANGSGLGPAFTVSGVQAGSVLQAGVDGGTASFSPVTFPLTVASGDILVGAQQDQVGSVAIGTPGQLLVATAGGPEWQTYTPSVPWASITGTPVTLAGYGLPNNISTGWGVPTGGSVQTNFAAGAATLPQTAAALAQLISDLTTAGVIGS